MSMSLEPVTVILHDERDCAGVIKVRILRWKPVLDSLGGPHVVTRCSEGKEGGRKSEKEV